MEDLHSIGWGYAVKLSSHGIRRSGVRVLDLESTVLQRIHKIQFAAGDVQRALRIDHNLNAGAFHHDVAIRRLVLQIHLVLQTGASPADDRHAQDAAGTPLLFEK